MSPRAFFFGGLLGLALVAGLIAAASWAWDPYGLFRDAEGRALPVYAAERTSKHLLARRYIPENFEGVLFGPSQSDNLDPRGLAPLEVYNASLNGGNASELKLIMEALLGAGPPRFVILCLSDYITKDYGRKTHAITPDEVRGALGSLASVKLLKPYLDVTLRGRPAYADAVGYKDFTLDSPDRTPAEVAREIETKRARYQRLVTDDRALKDLQAMIDAARGAGVKVFAYFHPYPEARLEIVGEPYREYQARVRALFSPEDVILDLCDEVHEPFRRDLSNYRDSAHLSVQGARAVVAELKALLARHL